MLEKRRDTYKRNSVEAMEIFKHKNQLTKKPLID